jgi:hypothetical protein
LALPLLFSLLLVAEVWRRRVYHWYYHTSPFVFPRFAPPDGRQSGRPSIVEVPCDWPPHSVATSLQPLPYYQPVVLGATLETVACIMGLGRVGQDHPLYLRPLL